MKTILLLLRGRLFWGYWGEFMKMLASFAGSKSCCCYNLVAKLHTFLSRKQWCMQRSSKSSKSFYYVSNIHCHPGLKYYTWNSCLFPFYHESETEIGFPSANWIFHGAERRFLLGLCTNLHWVEVAVVVGRKHAFNTYGMAFFSVALPWKHQQLSRQLISKLRGRETSSSWHGISQALIKK